MTKEAGTLLSTKATPNNDSATSVSVDEVYEWASQLAAEDRDERWVVSCYVWPEPVKHILDQLMQMKRQIIGLVGLQGTGKTNALQTLMVYLRDAGKERKPKTLNEKEIPIEQTMRETEFFKWRREAELFESLLNSTHELSRNFRYCYRKKLLTELMPRYKYALARGLNRSS